SVVNPDVRARRRRHSRRRATRGGNMLMPGLSVTLIGIAIAALGMVRYKRALPVLGRGLVGAWVGFACLALIGLAIDILLFDGVYVAILGHLGAAAGAGIAVARARARQYT